MVVCGFYLYLVISLFPRPPLLRIQYLFDEGSLCFVVDSTGLVLFCFASYEHGLFIDYAFILL